MKPNIVNLESGDYSYEAVNILSSIGDVKLLNLYDQNQVTDAIASAHIIISRLRFILDEKLLKNARNLLAVATPTTGVDHVDLDYLKSRNIALLALKGERAFLDTVYATAEHTIALIFTLLRNIVPAHCDVVINGRWDRNTFKGRELENKTVGIIGLGRLGTKVAHYLQIFGCKVLATDVKKVSIPKHVSLVNIDTLLKHSDIVSVHIDFNSDNYHFIDNDCFRKMKSGTLFINTSRGGCVDEGSLTKYLKSGHLSGAAIDVMEGELHGKITDSQLFQYAQKHNNLIITPHIGGATYESMEKTEIFIAQKIKNFLLTK